MKTDHSHDFSETSWAPGTNDHPEFPLQNLPMGIHDSDGGRIIVAIGDHALDVRTALDLGHLASLNERVQAALKAPSLNAWMSLDAASRLQIRHALFLLLKQNSPASRHGEQLLRPQNDCPMALPAQIGDYTDFYCGIHHAMKVGAIYRPENPLLPNYRYQPIAYHGRSSSIRVSGESIQRPRGQVSHKHGVRLTLSEMLDFELELAMWVGPGNKADTSISFSDAQTHIAGYGLFNDWSARDIQAWEYRPLGPFQGKNFASTVSPWIVTQDALMPFRTSSMPRSTDDPQLLDYLVDAHDQATGGLDIHMDVYLLTPLMRSQSVDPYKIARSHCQHLYWTPAQMLIQHTLNGCNLRPGDLVASGTISTPDESGNGSLMELTRAGTVPLTLPTGESRTFLENGDEVIFTAYCYREGFRRIGFGECRAQLATESHF